MRLSRFKRLFLVIPLFFALFAVSKTITREQAISQALERIKVDSRKLSFNLVFTDLDPFRFRFINRLMQHPLEAFSFTDSLTNTLVSESKPYKLAHNILSVTYETIPSPVLRKGPGDYPWKAEAHLTPELKKGLDILYDAVIQANELIGFIKRDFTFQQRESLYNFIPYILEIDGQEAGKKAELTLEEEDSLWKEEYKLTKSVLNLAAKLNREKIIEAGLVVANAAELAIKSFSEIKVRNLKAPRSYEVQNAAGDILYYGETPYGAVIVGGAGRTIYRGRFLIIVDLGGDDDYRVSAGGADTTQSISISIDLDGNDLYRSDSRYSFGAGFLGVGVLYDCAGNDFYETKNFSLGVGVCGFGLLIDMAGDDIYRGDTGTEGVGYVGFGGLFDGGGNDVYISNFAAQGFGFVGGVGFLYDASGNDFYVAQGKYEDKLRRPDHYLSMAQGFGFGSRPDFSGGVGVLLDKGTGNDIYVADVFGQGSSYWYGYGALIDCGGDDLYSAFQYAQGCGTHFTVGVLFDYEGDDRYLSRSVSQGCGHDVALGLLNDKKGNDSYTIYELSQGAGNANGIGIFVDEEGDDSYLVRREETTQGYGNFRREYGSIGLMLDLGGKDIYFGKGAEDSEWLNGKYGIGIDFPSLKK